jgi:acetoin:2,6-dichlorophenolindophenol oxidoreductase subunit beta
MTKLRYAEALNQALREEMQRDPNVFVFGEDIARYGGVFKVTKGLMDEFGTSRVRGDDGHEANPRNHVRGLYGTGP